ncbi:hypothetical protein BCR33DRAFT_557449 [Rhizoclosmatium globosum]|uniref:Uncharacterized protein n=1 Tax=Rhizoclosmatium globosum TaxID=329046 RepID=A0A1Y2CSU2_9FUNG|nr:hypothetical protein BCR33DRAFT_557449 [Rhizoclosmatium globosum]|eukprot:ORY49956.1 hypothetical protein BCR33DRAFT_557449 [Rhizoclosmatium globosum]
MLLHKWTGGHETYEQYSKAFDDFAQMVRAQKGISAAGPFPRDKIYDGQFWMGHVHDCDRGRITNVAVSFDEAFMCSSGADGGIFMFRFTPKEVQEKEAPNFDFYEADEQIPTQDIIDKAVYTIQETKIKSERDREIFEAEQKKQATRDYISELRSEYLKLVATMDAANIPRSSIAVDPDLKQDIENETLQRIANVRKELEWVSEKESIGPNKLKRKFLDPVETFYIRVTALKSAWSVSTFRTLKLPEKMDFGIQTLLNNERAVSRGHADGKGGVGGDVGDGGEKAKDLAGRNTIARKQMKEPKDSRSKLEARKALRAERAQLWKQLLEEKPDENYEDRRDVAAIRISFLRVSVLTQTRSADKLLFSRKASLILRSNLTLKSSNFVTENENLSSSSNKKTKKFKQSTSVLMNSVVDVRLFHFGHLKWIKDVTLKTDML